VAKRRVIGFSGLTTGVVWRVEFAVALAVPASIAPAALVAPLLHRLSKLFVLGHGVYVSACASDTKPAVWHRRDPGLLDSYNLHQLHAHALASTPRQKCF